MDGMRWQSFLRSLHVVVKRVESERRVRRTKNEISKDLLHQYFRKLCSSPLPKSSEKKKKKSSYRTTKIRPVRPVCWMSSPELAFLTSTETYEKTTLPFVYVPGQKREKKTSHSLEPFRFYFASFLSEVFLRYTLLFIITIGLKDVLLLIVNNS